MSRELIDECRKAFEAWCFDYNGKRPVLDEHGGYGLGRNYDRWMAWQGAWELQEIKLGACIHEMTGGCPT